MRRLALLCVLVLAAEACGGGVQLRTTPRDEAKERVRSGARAEQLATAGSKVDPERCDASKPRRETSEYDTSGDDVPDVRKVFVQMGEAPLLRMVMICREVDLNADGVKDVVRSYDDDGSPLREASDRNFDGQMDQLTLYQDGQIVRQDIDENGDGKTDTRLFFENGRVLRTERDLAGRSTAQQWRPNRWEYFEDGQMIRMGTDSDGDGVVDRWDRDEPFFAAEREKQAQDNEADVAGVADADDTPDDG